MNTLEEKKQSELFTIAHHDFEKGLTRHSFFKIHNRMVSEDLVQDTFIKTWRYLVRGGKIEVMKAFLYHVLNDLIIDEYRKHKTLSLDTMVENGYEPVNKENERSMNIFSGKEAIHLIDRLPFKYRNIMKMRYVQDLSLSEMSLLTHQSKNTLAVQIHRGLEKLRLLYNPIQKMVS